MEYFLFYHGTVCCVYWLEPPRRSGSYEYPQSTFLSRNMKNNIYPCKPQFYYIKVGFNGVKIIQELNSNSLPLLGPEACTVIMWWTEAWPGRSSTEVTVLSSTSTGISCPYSNNDSSANVCLCSSWPLKGLELHNEITQLAFLINLQRTVIGPSASLTGR